MVKASTRRQKSSSVGQRYEGKAELRTTATTPRRKLAYEIRLKNHLQGRWAEWFDGWRIVNVENHEVVLICSNTDHAGLHGVLDKIRDLNLALISVKRIPVDSAGCRADLKSEDGKKARRTR